MPRRCGEKKNLLPLSRIEAAEHSQNGLGSPSWCINAVYNKYQPSNKCIQINSLILNEEQRSGTSVKEILMRMRFAAEQTRENGPTS
jgi:hypothetical protein